MFDEKSQAEYDPNSPSLGATTSADEDKRSRHELDLATQYLRDHQEWADYDHLEAKKVRQKIDWRIMPLMVVTNTIGAVDKIIVSNAALYGMIEDTRLVGQQYNWMVSIFYLGWLVAEYPANAILQKFHIWLPDSPLKAYFLTGKDKYIALDRVRENMIGIENMELKWYQVREAFTDYKTYLLVLFVLSIHVPTGGVVAFGAQIVSGLGFTNRCDADLVEFHGGSSPAVVQEQEMLSDGALLHSPCHLPRENKVGRLLAYYFFYFFWGQYATAISLPMGDVSGHTKKLTVYASIFVAYCAANMVGPQVFFIHEAPNYPTGYNTLLGFEVAAICCITAYAVGCFLENKQRDREGTNVSVGADEQFRDLTDYERGGVRHLY
ncbi:hypothetical protein NW759_010704 [Fusarium solani]|nr:hypothetical protein NW759_010704 [Fusarium solani]